MENIRPSIIRQLFFLLVIIFMAILIFGEMMPYLSGVLGAITLYVILRRWMLKLLKKRWNSSLAAAALMLLSLAIIVIPVVGVLLLLGNKVGQVVENSTKVLDVLKRQLSELEKEFGFELTSQIDVSAITSWLSENLQSLAGGTFTIFIALGVMYFLLFYMLTNGKKMRESIMHYLPIRNENLRIIGAEVQLIVRSNALGIPLVAIAQGVIALIGFFIFNIPDPFFWFVIVTVGSMIPFVGTFIGIVPVFILSLSNGTNFQAWGILLYGMIVVGSTDNILRIYALKKLDNVHPLITLIGVIVGVPLFGFIGLIFGPLLISLFLILVKLYKSEFGTPT